MTVLLAMVGDGPPAWYADALCAQTDPEAFFPEKGGSTREAKAVCGRCDVRAECLEYALDHGERYGIWGGVSERDRRRLTRDRSRPAPVVLPDPKPLRRSDGTGPAITATRGVPVPTAPTPSGRDVVTDLDRAHARPRIIDQPQGGGSPFGHVPPYIVDFALLLRDTEGDPDPVVRAARKDVANAAYRLHRIVNRPAVTIELDEPAKPLPAAKPARQPKPPRQPGPGRGACGAGIKAAKQRLDDLGVTSRQVRAWAAGAGVPCPASGMVPADVVDAFVTAHRDVAA